MGIQGVEAVIVGEGNLDTEKFLSNYFQLRVGPIDRTEVVVAVNSHISLHI